MEYLLLLYPGLPVIMSCASHLIFWYEARSSGYAAELDRISGGRAGRWTTRSMLTDCVSLSAAVLLTPFHFLKRLRLPADRGPGGPPVIFVHGLYHNTSAWFIFARRLARRGLLDLHIVGYNSLTSSYWDIVDQLDKTAAWILENRPPGTRVALVGHSLGGLVIRGWLSNGENAGRALAAVTLGAPHGGSRMAGLGVGELAKGLMHRSGLIREIEGKDKEPPCPALSLYSPTDCMVIPHEDLRMGVRGWEERQTPPMSHVAMLYSGYCAEAAAEFIQEAASSESSPVSRRKRPA